MSMSSNGTEREILACLSSYSGKYYMTDYQRYILVTVDVLIMVLSYLASIVVFISLLMAKFLRDTSLIFLFFISVADICTILISQTLFTVLIGRFSDQTCTLDMIAEFFAVFLLHCSGYGVACIGFDVYLRMCFPKRYTLMITKRRVFTALTFISLISFFQGICYVLGTQHDVFGYARKVVLGIDSIVVFLVILTHILVVKVAKDHCKNSGNRNLFTKFDWMLTKVVTKVLRVRFSLLATYFVISVCYLLMNEKVNKNGKSWLNFALHTGYLLSYCNTVSNALLFLKMNRSQNLKIQLFPRSARVRPRDPLRDCPQNQEAVS